MLPTQSVCVGLQQRGCRDKIPSLCSYAWCGVRDARRDAWHQQQFPVLYDYYGLLNCMVKFVLSAKVTNDYGRLVSSFPPCAYVQQQ